MSCSLPLEATGLSRSSRERLQRAGFRSVKDVQALRPTQLAHELGCTPAVALAILTELRAPIVVASSADGVGNGGGGEQEVKSGDVGAPSQSKSPPIVHAAKVPPAQPQFGENALELLRRRAGVKPIPVLACDDLDAMMAGGVPVGQITEFCGVPGAGKTQLCMQLACNVQIPKRLGGAWEGEALYIDTEGSFLARRAEAIAEGTVEWMTRKVEASRARSLAAGRPVGNNIEVPKVDDLLKGIHVMRAYDHVEQLAAVKALPSFLREHPHTHLLVIDSVAFHFRRGFTDMGLRARLLTGMAQELLYLANKYQLAVVVTNQVTTRLEGGGGIGGSGLGGGAAALSPALGESWAHSCTNRVMLDFEGAGRVARMLKSPTMKAARVPYDITERGITQKMTTQQQQQQQSQASQQQQLQPTQQQQQQRSAAAHSPTQQQQQQQRPPQQQPHQPQPQQQQAPQRAAPAYSPPQQTQAQQQRYSPAQPRPASSTPGVPSPIVAVAPNQWTASAAAAENNKRKFNNGGQ